MRLQVVYIYCLAVLPILVLSSPTLEERPPTSATVWQSSTSTVSLASTHAFSTPIYLDVSGQPPDIIGVSKVSGWYGPGTWSGWFLTICGSWVHIFVDQPISKLDLNGWAYLAYANWAAIKMVVKTNTIRQLRLRHETAAWQQEAASVGAPMTILFWTIFHGTFQIMACAIQNHDKKKHGQNLVRQISICVGLALPTLAFVIHYIVLFEFKAAGFALTTGGEVSDLIPAIYFPGMDNSSHSDIMLGIGCLFGWFFYVVLPILCLLVVLWISLKGKRIWIQVLLQRRFGLKPDKLWVYIGRPLLIFYAFANVVGCLFSLIFHLPSMMVFILFPVSFLLVAFEFYMIGGVAAMFAPFYTVKYVVLAYVLRRISPSDSCFFMPCTSHSITDWDQGGALFMGLVLFIGGECLFPLFFHWRRKRQETIALEQELSTMNFRMSAARRSNTAGLEEGVGGSIGRQATGADASDSAAGQHITRVNSGLVRD